MSIAFFAGSFNPFTIGHASVVERALPLFDRIIIGIGSNAEKADEHNNLNAIREFAKRFNGKVDAVSYNGMLTVDAARHFGADCLLRGVRSVKDFEYERDLADINRRIGAMETVILFALPDHGAISSSVVRELASYGRDTSDFLP